MELVERRESTMVGIVVVGAFAELATLVPAAWRSLAEAGAPRDATYAELSRAGADGTYVECLGLLDDSGPGSHGLAEQLDGELVVERVTIQAGTWVRGRHDGPEEEIAAGFGRLFTWASGNGLEPTGELLDVGYRLDVQATGHELWVRVTASAEGGRAVGSES